MATIDKKQLQTFAEEYFSSQNYLNKRILEDVSKVRSEYDENIWSKMNVGEREKVIALTNLQVLYQNIMNLQYNRLRIHIFSNETSKFNFFYILI